MSHTTSAGHCLEVSCSPTWHPVVFTDTAIIAAALDGGWLAGIGHAERIVVEVHLLWSGSMTQAERIGSAVAIGTVLAYLIRALTDRLTDGPVKLQFRCFIEPELESAVLSGVADADSIEVPANITLMTHTPFSASVAANCCT